MGGGVRRALSSVQEMPPHRLLGLWALKQEGLGLETQLQLPGQHPHVPRPLEGTHGSCSCRDQARCPLLITRTDAFLGAPAAHPQAVPILDSPPLAPPKERASGAWGHLQQAGQALGGRETPAGRECTHSRWSKGPVLGLPLLPSSQPSPAHRALPSRTQGPLSEVWAPHSAHTLPLPGLSGPSPSTWKTPTEPQDPPQTQSHLQSVPGSPLPAVSSSPFPGTRFTPSLPQRASLKANACLSPWIQRASGRGSK